MQIYDPKIGHYSKEEIDAVVKRFELENAKLSPKEIKTLMESVTGGATLLHMRAKAVLRECLKVIGIKI